MVMPGVIKKGHPYWEKAGSHYMQCSPLSGIVNIDVVRSGPHGARSETRRTTLNLLRNYREEVDADEP